MLFEERKDVDDLSHVEIKEFADYLCHKTPEVRPIFECVKVYARIHKGGEFTYARHPFDLGTTVIGAKEISARMNCERRQQIVEAALKQVEASCESIWPFSSASSSWVLLEILHPLINIAAAPNKPAVIFRRAVRLSSKGKTSTTPLLEKMFRRLERSLNEYNELLDFEMLVDPVLYLRNISGTGVYTKFSDQLEGIAYLAEGNSTEAFGGLHSYYGEIIEDFVEELFESNFDVANEFNPGFSIKFREEMYVVRPKSFMTNKGSTKVKERKYPAPLPVAGIIK